MNAMTQLSEYWEIYTFLVYAGNLITIYNINLLLFLKYFLIQAGKNGYRMDFGDKIIHKINTIYVYIYVAYI